MPDDTDDIHIRDIVEAVIEQKHPDIMRHIHDINRGDGGKSVRIHFDGDPFDLQRSFLHSMAYQGFVVMFYSYSRLFLTELEGHEGEQLQFSGYDEDEEQFDLERIREDVVDALQLNDFNPME